MTVKSIPGSESDNDKEIIFPTLALPSSTSISFGDDIAPVPIPHYSLPSLVACLQICPGLNLDHMNTSHERPLLRPCSSRLLSDGDEPLVPGTQQHSVDWPDVNTKFSYILRRLQSQELSASVSVSLPGRRV